MNWSQDINKMFMAKRAKHYRGHKADATLGYLMGENVWLASIALSDPKQADHCPYCGCKQVVKDETMSRVKSESEDMNDLDKLYYEGEFKCAGCGKWWKLRSKIGRTGAVIDFYPPRTSNYTETV